MDHPDAPPPARSRRPLWRALGLNLASAVGTPLLGFTGMAALLGGWHFVVMGLGAVLLAAAIGVAAWSPHRRRLAGGLALAGLALALPFSLPIAHAQHGGALLRSRSVFGGDGGTPWFAGVPEDVLVRTGEGIGWSRHERRTLEAHGGGVASSYAAYEAAGLFERTESVVLDSWLFDRGHYFLAVPPDASPEAKAPLIVFLHGNGGNFRAFPAWLAPQAAARGIATAYPTWGFGSWRSPEAARRVLDVIDDAAASEAVDPSRVVLCGLSAGAVGAAYVQRAHPERFRAVALISGAPLHDLEPAEARIAARAPFYLVHGDEDGHLPVAWSRRFVAAVEAAGGQVTYHEVPGADHTLLHVRRDEVLTGVLDWADPLLELR